MAPRQPRRHLQRWAPVILAFAFLQPGLAKPGGTPPTVVEPGHSAIWYAPERSGEGWVLEILGGQLATLTWFTYDDTGAQRWLFSLGTIVEDGDGQRIEFAELRDSRGGRFGEGFDPGAIESDVVGRLSLRFEDCHRGRLEYEAYGHAEAIDVQRLVARTMAAGCAPVHGVTGEPIHPYAAQSGSWFHPTRSGEGFQLQFAGDGTALLTWYTYDDAGNPYWLTGVGQREDDGEGARIVFPDIQTTRGGRFGEHHDPARVQLIDWGSLELRLDCDAGAASFDSSLPGFGQGTRPLHQLTRAVPVDCPWTPPKLTDLYDLEYVELPMPRASSMMDPARIDVHGIADDGTVLGSGKFSDGRGGVMLLRPGSREWEIIGDDSLRLGRTKQSLISPDGRTVYSDRETTEVDSDGFEGRLIMRWREGTGWQELPGTGVYFRNVLFGMSKDARHLVGQGYHAGHPGSHAWKWNEATGQMELPFSDSIRAGVARAISNDGKTIIGETIIGQAGTFPLFGAIRWQAADPPERLYSSDGTPLAIAKACNADCSLIFGEAWSNLNASEPTSYQSWVIDQPNQRFFHLGFPDAEQLPGLGAGVEKVSDDGNIVTGVYGKRLPGNGFYEEAWLWTQNTGAVSFLDLLEMISNGDEPWPNLISRVPAGMTSNGKTILFRGIHSHDSNSPAQYPAAVLHLTPKTTEEARASVENVE